MKASSWLPSALTTLVLFVAASWLHAGTGVSLSLEGNSGQCVVVPASTNLSPPHITMEAWINVFAPGQLTILSRGNGSIANTDYIFQIGDDGLGDGTRVSFYGAGGWDVSTANIPLNTWTHVAASFDGTNKYFYINGVPEGTASRAGNSLYTNDSSVTPMYIGRQGSNCSCNFFQGQIAEVRLWSTVRTTNQISADMTPSPNGSVTGLVAYYHLNEGEGTNAIDASNNGYTGALTNGASWSNTGPLSLGTGTRVEGPAAGTDSAVLAVGVPTVAWTATTNAPWLHLSVANQSGAGSANVNFTYDANPGPPRSGTLSIAGQTLTVMQAGSNYVAVPGLLTPLVSAGLKTPHGVAVDGAGNVYIADAGDNAIKEWSVTNGTVMSLVSTGLSNPSGVAVDGVGNVYIADTSNNVVKEWSVATNHTVSTLVSNGLNLPFGVAVDVAGNVYVGPGTNNTIKEWVAASSVVTLLVTNGLSDPSGLAVDEAGNVYISDNGNNEGKEWSVLNHTVVPVAGVSLPLGVAVDGAGDVYFAANGSSTVQELAAANFTLSTVVSSGLKSPWGMAVDGMGNLYVSDSVSNTVGELQRAFVVPTGSLEGPASGNDVLPQVVPTTANLAGPFAPTTSQSWLTITGVTNGVVSYAFTNNSGPTRTANLTLLGQQIPVTQAGSTYVEVSAGVYVDLTPRNESASAGTDALPTVLPATTTLQPPPTSSQNWLTITGVTNGVLSFSFAANSGNGRTAFISFLGISIPVTQAGQPNLGVLGSTQLLAGPGAATDSVTLSSPDTPWTATTNAPWLHLRAGYQSGTSSTNVIFSYDANAGSTRTGTLKIAGQVLTVTQAGSTYVAAPGLLPVADYYSLAAGLLTLDGAGNVYFADDENYVIEEWLAADNSLSTLLASGLNDPSAEAVDGAGNVYIADTYNNAIKKWNPTNGAVTTVVSGLNQPSGLALDGFSNICIADTYNNAVREWSAVNNTVATPVSSGVGNVNGVAVDVAGNIYLTDAGNSAVKEWSIANNTVRTLVSYGLNDPWGVAVDGRGNVYFADYQNHAIEEWLAASNNFITLGSTLPYAAGVALDGAGNLFISSSLGISELPHAFVDPTPRQEVAAAGNDSLPVILPSTARLSPPFVPVSDQPWLTVTGVTNGVVSFSFSSNTGPARAGVITVLGQGVRVVQAGNAASGVLATTSMVEGPAAGTDSVVLASATAWTATANTNWLHLSPANQSGATGANVVFSFDVNSGATRTGTLTIAGQTLTVTQAGATYVPAPVGLATLASLGTNYPTGVAVNNQGNVYLACYYDICDYNGSYYECYPYNLLQEWSPASQAVSTLISSPYLYYPLSVAADLEGNVYFSDATNNAVDELIVENGAVNDVVTSGLNAPNGVAVDNAGNIYIADPNDNAIKKWFSASDEMITLVAGPLYESQGVAVDRAGNVYIADSYYGVIWKWSAADSSLTALVSSGLANPCGVAVDSSGNVYIADTYNNLVREWSPINGSVTTLPGGMSQPRGVAVDGAGNVYIADTGRAALEEVPRAFVSAATVLEGYAAGNDVLPAVLPATENLKGVFAPSSSQTWLTITGVTNGVVSFAFTATTTNRSATLTLLGQAITVLQENVGRTTVLTGAKLLANGSFQFAFTNIPGAAFTVLTSTNMYLPLTNWTALGAPVESPPGHYVFTTTSVTNRERFFTVASP